MTHAIPNTNGLGLGNRARSAARARVLSGDSTLHAPNPYGAAMPDDRQPLTYAGSGVDIDAGNRIVDRIRPLARATRRSGANAELGGFGGLFDLKAAGFIDPILVAANDGVGTKLKIAIESGIYDSVGV